MGSLDPAKILMILVVILIVMGPERLPKVARQAGAILHELVRVRQEVSDEVRSVMPDLDLNSIPRIPSVRGTLSGLITEPSPAARAGTGTEASTGAAVDAGPPAPAGSPPPALGEFSPAADDPSMN
ncbi:MAG: twin-arginine translocase TatA/TatE family subunit [Acidimicrobiales bacterium]